MNNPGWKQIKVFFGGWCLSAIDALSLTLPGQRCCMCVHMMNAPKFDDTTSYGLLKILEDNPGLSQRDLAGHLGISLGKVNFCLKALIEKGCLKVNNFRSSNNKLAYAYLLTPHGVEERARMTAAFLQYKMQEYDRLRAEIDELRREAERQEGEA